MTTPYQPPPDQNFAAAPQPLTASQLLAPQEMVPAARGVTAFLSAQTRSGDWILPRLFRAVSFWGAVEIDLTSARFGAGTSRIEVVAIMGSIEVFVPPDVRVQCDGDAIVGSFEVRGQKWSMPGPDAPTVHITGTAYLGSVEVKIVNPNAPTWIQTLKHRWNQVRSITSGER
ncbi:MAG: LiaF domain-containing protein [Gemmatimonadota bacterium]